ncbi:MAG: tetratricopeptide repeat protein [Roseofilum sp. SID2]|uniref:tetratricopeptide repeat protein n=1 Tax=Roseofilum sp. SID2 TaxID=2821498 RepID=UPI001B1BF85A|nr:tetratricopeptide repeat protein [Roseofilum sp. SID2]MBP0022609.1 tetratricopeptide repeat protein [Roseofilum sp. SID2]
MNPPSLDTVLDSYAKAIQPLEHSDAPVTEEEALEILQARDVVAQRAEKLTELSFEQQKRLVTLDTTVRGNAWQICQSLNLPAWRNSFRPPEVAWWWYLDQDVKHPRWDKLDGLWRGLTLAGWTVNLGLLIDLIPRFFMGGTGLGGAVAIAFPSLLTLLQAKSELTETGKEGFNKLLERFGIPKYFHAEAQLVSTVILTGILVSLRSLLPSFSDMARQRAFEHYNNGQIAQAEADYQQALALNPDNIEVHYSLGVVYEDLQQFDKAKTEYLFAVKGGYPKAYNNLARLHILEKKPNLAVPLLVQGLAKLEESPASEIASDIGLKYNLFKNLGWAFLQQGASEDEAEKFLRIAIEVSSNTEGIEQIQNRASAHCLLAQVYEIQKKQSEALEQWKQCAELGSILNPDEVDWISLARKKIEEEN